MKATDTRTALKNGTTLRFYNNDNGLVTYAIQNEIGRGGSCIVYNAFYSDNSGGRKRVKIKECYPFALNIFRKDTNELVPDKSDAQDFEKCKEDFKKDFKICSELFETKGLTNSVVNTIDIYEANNTFYVVSVYDEGTVLSETEAANYSLKEIIETVKGTALVIRKIHEKGYLYLDVKPENIFVYEGAKGLVQLFDFGSLIPIDSDQKEKYIISYTEGFAAIEQRNRQIKRIGKHSDVYSVGALLFYLLFDRTPKYFDCADDAAYDFDLSIISEKLSKYNHKLFPALTEFFHNSLASYYLDRYENMDRVISKLDEIEKYSDITVPYVISTNINRPCFFSGRDNELEQLGVWYEGKDNVLFISGMGGIGKSSLVREYLSENYQKFDTVLYLYYRDSIKATITDDRQVCINTVQKDDSETADDYFERKLLMLRRLIYGTESVIVIDNYNGSNRDISDIFNICQKVIIITRQNPIAEFESLQIGAISERKNLHFLFEKHLHRSLDDNEKIYLNRIIDKVNGHTLILELIAKQTASSYLSVAEAEELIDKYGFTDFAKENVEYFKDQTLYNGSVSKITAAIFDYGHFSDRKKAILKMLSLFDVHGINVHTFVEMLALETKNEINELIKNGWIENHGTQISLHPVIKEVAAKWAWTEYFISAAIQTVDFVFSKIKSKTETSYHLNLGETILKSCENEPSLYNMVSCKRLLCQTVINAPIYREDYIIKYSNKCLSNCDILDGNEVLNVYDMLIAVYEQQGELKKAFGVIKKTNEYVITHPDPYNWGLFYNILAGYYDVKLDGCYDACNAKEIKLLKKLLAAENKSIEYIKIASGKDSAKLLAGYSVGKANLLIRSGISDAKTVKGLLIRIGKLITEDLLLTPENIGYLLACAWYYTYMEIDLEKSIRFMKKACKLAKDVFSNDLDIIDNSVIPCANILLEHREFRQSADLVLKGIDICRCYDDIAPYVRKKNDLYDYLLDIYEIEGNSEEYQKVLTLIEKEKENSV